MSAFPAQVQPELSHCELVAEAVPSLPEKNARQGFFEKHELKALLPYLPEPLDDMTRFAAICGWRLSEIRLLRWDSDSPSRAPGVRPLRSTR